MTTELATLDAAPVSAATLEAVVVGGDLSKLSPAQRLEWYNARCAAAGLDPRTQPFQYLSLQNKLTLYATKTATDQLIAVHKLRVEVVDRKAHADLGVYEVQVRVTRQDGSTVDDLAAVSIGGLRGDNLCNAFMKCVTKAKRRTVLSACGLGMLDESEVETIPNARVVAYGEPAQSASQDPATDEWKPSAAQLRRIYDIAKKQAGITTKEDLRVLLDSIEGFPEKEGQLTREQYDQLCDEILPNLKAPKQDVEDADFEDVPTDGDAPV